MRAASATPAAACTRVEEEGGSTEVTTANTCERDDDKHGDDNKHAYNNKRGDEMRRVDDDKDGGHNQYGGNDQHGGTQL